MSRAINFLIVLLNILVYVMLIPSIPLLIIIFLAILAQEELVERRDKEE